MKAPTPGVSTYRTMSAHGKDVDKVLVFFIASESLKSSTMTVPHKAVRCVVQLQNVDTWKNVQKMPERLPGASGRVRHKHVNDTRSGFDNVEGERVLYVEFEEEAEYFQ